MSWLFSRALVEECSEGICSVGEQSAPSSGIPMQQAYCSQDKMTECSRLSRFGMMFKPLTGDLGEELLTLYLAVFRDKTYQLQGKEQELQESGQECGTTWRGSLAKYDPSTHSLRTAQCSLFEDLTESCVTLPRWGSMRNGVLYLRQIPALRTCGSESGLWATPTTMDKLPPKSPEALQREATVARPGRSKPANLRDQVSNMQRWPTPQASDNKDRGNLLSPCIARRKEKGKQIMLSQCVSTESGRLNPTWVEKLMGWPDDWTSLNSISHVKMMFWFMGFCDDENRRIDEVLRMLREGNAAQEIREEIGRFVSIQEAAVLLSKLCEYSNKPNEARIFMACAEALESGMPVMRVYESITSASYRPGHYQQCSREHTDTMQTLSRLLAYFGEESWKDGSWEDAVPRVANGVAARMDRLTAIGNGQVPRVAATAFNILSNRIK